MARFRRAPRRRTAPRRKRIWAREQHSFQAVTPATVHDMCEDWCAAYGTNNLPPGVTIGGVYLDYWFRLNNAAGLGVGSFIKLGIVVVDDANLTDNSEVPRPIRNPHVDWLFYNPITPQFSSNAVEVTFANHNEGSVVIRARRKIEEIGQRLFWSVELNEPSDTLDGVVTTSTLLLLP